MRHFSSSAFLIVIALLLPSRATADLSVVTQTNFGPGVFNPMSIQPFDPALGTLTSVNVTLNGQVTANVTLVPECGGAICGPYDVMLDQNFFGINPAFFSFGTDATYDFKGLDTSLIQSYNYTFTFDAFTDNILNGFTLPNFSPLGVGNAAQIIPPVDIIGTRANFLPTLAGLNEINNLLTATVLSPATIVGNYSDAGTLVVEYNYTPAPVPEPASILLIMTGIGSLITRKLFSAN